MKTFPYTIPGTAVTFPAAVIGFTPVIVINPPQGTAFGEWPVYQSAERMQAGDPPVGKIERTFSGAEAQALKLQHADLFQAIMLGWQAVGEAVATATPPPAMP